MSPLVKAIDDDRPSICKAEPTSRKGQHKHAGKELLPLVF